MHVRESMHMVWAHHVIMNKNEFVHIHVSVACVYATVCRCVKHMSMRTVRVCVTIHVYTCVIVYMKCAHVCKYV